MSRFTNHTDGVPGPQGPAGDPANTGDFTFEGSEASAPGDISIISTTAPGSVTLSAYAEVVLAYSQNGGAYLNTVAPENHIATIGDIQESIPGSVVRYSPTFTATGLTFTGSNGTYPTYNSYYVKTGKLVSFVIEVNCATVTNFGTGQYKLQLPFTPAIGYNHFSGWAHIDTTVNPDVTNGHILLNVDHAGITDILDLHYLKQNGGANSPVVEGLFFQGTPVTLTNSSKIYVNGTYISA